MIKHIFTGIILVISTISCAQDFVERSISKYTIKVKAPDKVFQVRMDYGKATISNAEELKELDFELVKRVDLVYTSFAESNEFNQKKLNQARISELKKVAPEIFNNELTTWNLVAQHGCKSKEDGEHFLHGFYIYYRPQINQEERDKEIAALLKSLHHPPEDYIKPKPKPKNVRPGNNANIIKVDTLYRDKRGRIITDPKKIFVNGKRSKLVAWSYPPGPNDAKNLPDLINSEAKVTQQEKATLDKALVSKVLKRNNWNNMMVVTDVTASMYPYLSQVLLWLKINGKEGRIKQYVFFNDGDGKKTFQKPIGNAGGIYMIQSDSFNLVLSTAVHSMKYGNGGDVPENNLEAMIKGSENCPDCNEIVLIADNWATPRDLSLYNKITKPVHIIICGSEGVINTNYLNLAVKLKATVHTGSQDYDLFKNLKEGDTITIGKKSYKFSAGKLSLVE